MAQLALSIPDLWRRGLALAMVGLPRPLGARAMIEQAAALGARAVQLDATHAELRPRDLARSARKDLAALLRRCSLACSGVDLFVPPGHLVDAERASRAIEAFEDAFAFAADLVQLAGAPAVLSTALPSGDEPLTRSALDQLAASAEAHGVRVADHGWTPRGHARAQVERDAPIGVGLDPAAILLAEHDPSRAASTLGAPAGPGIAAARLSDSDGSARTEPGVHGGRLDALAYAVALHTAGYERHVVLDVRGVSDDPLACAARVLRRFGPAH